MRERDGKDGQQWVSIHPVAFVDSDQLKEVRVLSMHDDGSVPTPKETLSDEPEAVVHSPTATTGDE